MIVTLNWVCPICRGPRGEPYTGISWDGSRQLSVDCWRNPCGHTDSYASCRREANAASPVSTTKSRQITPEERQLLSEPIVLYTTQSDRLHQLVNQAVSWILERLDVTTSYHTPLGEMKWDADGWSLCILGDWLPLWAHLRLSARSMVD